MQWLAKRIPRIVGRPGKAGDPQLIVGKHLIYGQIRDFARCGLPRPATKLAASAIII